MNSFKMYVERYREIYIDIYIYGETKIHICVYTYIFRQTIHEQRKPSMNSHVFRLHIDVVNRR